MTFFDHVFQLDSIGIVNTRSSFCKRGPRLRIYASACPDSFVDFHHENAHQSIFEFVSRPKSKSINYVIVFAADETIRKINNYEFEIKDCKTGIFSGISKRQIIEIINEFDFVCFAPHERLGSFCIDSTQKITFNQVVEIWNKIMIRVDCNKYL